MRASMIVAAVTSHAEGRRYPTEVLIRAPEAGRRVDSIVLPNQIRFIDRRRLVKRLGAVDAPTMAHVDRALGLSPGLAGL